MFLNWLYSTGALTVVCLSPLWLRPIWIPMLTVIIELLLFISVRYHHDRKQPSCQLLMFVASNILLWSAITMMVIIYLFKTQHIGRFFDLEELNIDIPFLPVLIVGPFTVLFTGWAAWRRFKLPFCVNCRERNGSPAERGFLGTLYSQEGQWQIRLLLIIAIVITVVSWSYYLLRYVNVNLNSADRFFFCYGVGWIFVASTIYMVIRYLGIWNYYNMDVLGSEVRHGSSTRVRFLLISHDDKMFIIPPSSNPDRLYGLDATKSDTPTSIYIPTTNHITDSDARDMLLRMLPGITSPRIRAMYSNDKANVGSNIFHYLVLLNADDCQAVSTRYPGGEWFTISRLSKMIRQRELNPLLSSEIHRLFTIGMAWKTYDHQGRRLYSIRNYKPTFRLHDTIDWKVDFNDPHWFYVARNNQDKPLYTLKAWWRRHINGIR